MPLSCDAVVPLDPRIRANKAIAELGAPFLDRGLAKWDPPNRDRGFLYFAASLENLGSTPWRAHARAQADRIMDWFSMNPGAEPEELCLTVRL